MPSAQLVNASVEDPTTVNLTSTTIFTLTATSTATTCSNTDAVTIGISGGALSSTPTATPGTVCAGATVQLAAGAGGGSGTYTYSWTSVPAGFTSTSASPTVTPSVNTTYNVAVNDGFSTVNSNVSVIVNALPAQPTITAGGPTTFCAGGSVTLTSSAGSTYLWSTGATTASINVTTAGSYTVQVTNAAGCQSIASAATTVTVNALPAQPTITASGPTTFCIGGSVTLTSSAGSTYLWSTGATTQSINVTAAGSYTVRITNAAGCQSVPSAATTVIVNALPVVNAGTDRTIPNGTSTTINATVTGAGPFTYSWTPSAQLVNASVEDPTTVNLTSTTIFTLTATSTATSCSNTDAVTIGISGGPLSSTPTATPGTLCAGATVQLAAAASGGSGTYTYSWTSVPAGFTSTAASPTVTPSVNTTYYVAVNDGFSTVNSNVSVTVNALPSQPTITAEGPTTFCSGGSVTLTSSLGSTYLWSTGATTQSIIVTVAGNYTVRVTNASGCFSVSSSPVNIPVPPATPAAPTVGTITQPSFSVLTGSVVLSGLPATGIWTLTRNDGITLQGSGTSRTVSGLQPGTYTFTVTSDAGCTSLPTANITINAPPGAPNLVINNPATICSNQTTDLTAPAVTAGSDENLTYTYWLNAAATLPYATPAAATAGTYYISGTTTAGYSTIKPVVVTADQLPVPNAGPDQTLDYLFVTTLMADHLLPGTGIWSVLAGTGELFNSAAAITKLTASHLAEMNSVGQ